LKSNSSLITAVLHSQARELSAEQVKAFIPSYCDVPVQGRHRKKFAGAVRAAVHKLNVELRQSGDTKSHFLRTRNGSCWWNQKEFPLEEERRTPVTPTADDADDAHRHPVEVLKILSDVDAPTIAFPSYADPEMSVVGSALSPATLSFQLKAQLLTDDLVLIPDGCFFDSYAFWAVLARHGDELVNELCARSADGRTTVAVIQTNHSNLDVAFHAWLHRKGVLSPSVLRMGSGVIADVRRASAANYFDEVRATQTRLSLHEFATQMGLTTLRAALPCMEKLFAHADKLQKPADRHERNLELLRGRLNLLHDTQTPRMGEFLKHLGEATSVSRSHIQKTYGEVWKRYSPVINTVRQQVMMHPGLASPLLAPQGFDDISVESHRLVTYLAELRANDELDTAFILDEVGFKQIGAMRSDGLSNILRGLNEVTALVRKAEAGEPGSRRAYREATKEWRRYLRHWFPEVGRRADDHRETARQIATSTFLSDGTGPISGDMKSDAFHTVTPVAAERFRVRGAFIAADKDLAPGPSVFADLVARPIPIPEK